MLQCIYYFKEYIIYLDKLSKLFTYVIKLKKGRNP